MKKRLSIVIVIAILLSVLPLGMASLVVTENISDIKTGWY